MSKVPTLSSLFCQHTMVLALIALLILLPITAHSSSNNQERLKQIQSQIKELRQELDQTRTARNRAQNQLSHIEKRIGSLHHNLRKTQQQQQTTQERLSTLQQQQSESELRLKQHQNTLEKLIKLRHQQGEQGQLKLLINLQNISALGRNSSYLRYFNAAQTKAMDALNSELNNLHKLEQQGRKQQQQLHKTEQQLNQQQQQLIQEQQQRKELLGNINRQLQNKESQLRQLLEDAKALEQLLQRIKEESKKPQKATTKFATLKGDLPWPTNGKLSAKFGQSRNLGELTWEGLFISAPTGNDVQAVANGQIVFSDWLRGYGLLVIIDHGQGYLTLYGQNQSLNKQVGDWVEQGGIIATVGSSGGNNQPGLYFELRKQGKPINPRRWYRHSRPTPR